MQMNKKQFNKRPNILFVMADQQRYDCIGYSKDYPVKTPHIDRLASKGAWFTNAYTPIPICSPARQALLNGRRPEVFGANWNYDSCLITASLSPDEYSWPRELQKAGYQSAFIGKWSVNPKYDPTYYGFDKYIRDYEHQSFIEAKYPDLKYKNGWFGERNPVEIEDSHTHWLSSKAIDFIREYSKKDEPWHIRMDFSEPHLPCRPSSPFAEMYEPKFIPKWRSFDDTFEDKPYIQKQQLLNWNVADYTWEDWSKTVALYYGMISQVDDAIGRVVNMLEEMNLLENTIIVYTADHGDVCGGHRMMDKHYIMYDEVVKVPLIIRWTNKIQSETVIDSFVSNCLDLPPTLLDLIGLNQPIDHFHGKSLKPLLDGDLSQEWREDIVSTYNGQQFGLYVQRMLRNRKWKYIWNPTDVDELYDMENDPEELNNQIHKPDHTQLIARMRENLYYQLIKTKDGMALSPWMKDQLLNNRKL